MYKDHYKCQQNEYCVDLGEYPIDTYPRLTDIGIKDNKILNIKLGIDNKNFISLKRLKYTKNPLYKGWYEKVVNHFAQIAQLFLDKENGHISDEEFKRKIPSLYKTMTEISGQYIGFSQSSWNDKRGLGLNKKDFEALSESFSLMSRNFSTLSIEEIGELGLFFSTNIGQDKTSDFISGILKPELEQFTIEQVQKHLKKDKLIVTNSKSKKEKEAFCQIILTPVELTDAHYNNYIPADLYNEFIDPIKESLKSLGKDIVTRLKNNVNKSDFLNVMKEISVLSSEDRQKIGKQFLSLLDKKDTLNVMMSESNIDSIVMDIIENHKFATRSEINSKKIKNYCLQQCSELFNENDKNFISFYKKIINKTILKIFQADLIVEKKPLIKNLKKIQKPHPIIVFIVKDGMKKETIRTRETEMVNNLNEPIFIYLQLTKDGSLIAFE